jgi:hypothetical protein
MAYINVDVDIDDVLDSLSDREKQNLVDELYDEGFYQSEFESQLDASGEFGADYANASVPHGLYLEAVVKLRSNYLNLTPVEEEIIMSIAKRF